MRIRTALTASILVIGLSGCASDGGGGELGYATRGLRETDHTVGTDRPNPSRSRSNDLAAYVNGQGMVWDDIRTRMAERVGGAVLQEVVLERLLEETCAREGISISNDDLERERQLLIDTLADDGLELDGVSREALLVEILRRRNLGEAGFGALLLRTAMSRALVRDDVDLPPNAIDRAHDLRYGPRYEARLITTSTPADGTAALTRLRMGEPFDDVARDLSTDRSSATGGRIPSIHPADLSWPASIRQAVTRARIGEPTALIAIENGYALLVVEREITPPPSGLSAAEERAVATRDARLEAERLLMARLAWDLLAAADVDVLDSTLARAWERSEAR